jgi:hypothetical protein
MTILDGAAYLMEWALFCGIYAVLYSPGLWVLHQRIKNVWLRWAVIWLLVSSLDYLSLYDTEPWETNLSPFQNTMSLPGCLALLIIMPLLPLQSLLVRSFLLLFGWLPFVHALSFDDFFAGEPSWRSFLIIFSEDLIVCGLLYLVTRPIAYLWHRLRPEKPKVPSPELKTI